MSFKVNWPTFSKTFIESAQKQLTNALNSGKKIENIAGDIIVTWLEMGSVAPELEILEISELGQDRFKGIFKMMYHGDAKILLKTRVQANPLMGRTSRMMVNPVIPILAANKPLIVPMELKISQVKLRGVIVLVVDKDKGVTLVFKNDPLESVLINSTFDDIPNIRKMLQEKIETQFRGLFSEELPQMIHKLSLLFLKETKIEKTPVVYDLPHNQKWSGNEEHVDASEYVLRKSLDGVSSASYLGLSRLLEEERNEEVNMERLNSSSSGGYIPFGNHRHTAPLLPITQREALEFRSNMLGNQSSSSSSGSSDDFLRMRSNSLSSDTFSASDSLISTLTAPPATHRKGQVHDGMVWRRPGVQAMDKRPVRTQLPRVIPSIATLESEKGSDESQPINRQISSPKVNEVTAHLANLLTSHHTISPAITQDMTHLTYRGKDNPISPKASTVMEHQTVRKRRIIAKRVNTVRISITKFGISRSNSRQSTIGDNSSTHNSNSSTI